MNDLVFLKRDEALTDSLTVAEKFHKRHDTVLRTIDNHRRIAAVKERKLYHESSYMDAKGENRRMYLMNRQGYELLVMGFTGEDAIKWKLKYSDAFAAMESILREKSTQAWIETRRQGKLTRNAETAVIKKLVEYARNQGSSNADKLYITYSRLANKMAGIEHRNTATVSQLNNLSLMENIILHVIDTGILTGKHYKEIYQDCKTRLMDLRAMAYLG